MTEAVLELYGHSRRVGLIEWHPTSSGILFSAGYDYKVPAKANQRTTQRNATQLIVVQMKSCSNLKEYKPVLDDL